jgi:aldose 1-epimerase
MTVCICSCRCSRPSRADRARISGVCLHGGAKGIDTQEWTTIDRGASSVFASALFPVDDATYPPQGEESIFRLVSPAGDDGFPLTLEIEGLVQVVKQGLEPTMMVVLRARVMDDGTPELEMNKGTPVNLTVHWGFHLGSFDGVDDEDVRGHTLWIDVSAHSATPMTC